MKKFNLRSNIYKTRETRAEEIKEDIIQGNIEHITIPPGKDMQILRLLMKKKAIMEHIEHIKKENETLDRQADNLKVQIEGKRKDALFLKTATTKIKLKLKKVALENAKISLHIKRLESIRDKIVVQINNESRRGAGAPMSEEERMEARGRMTAQILTAYQQMQAILPILLAINTAGGGLVSPLIQSLLNTLESASQLSQLIRAPPQKQMLTEKEIEDIKEIEWDSSMISKNHTFECCPICYVDYTVKEKLKHLSCNHAFHTPCITEWLKKNATCPVCKHKLK